MKKLIYNKVVRYQPEVNKKNPFTHPPSCILPSFSQNTHGCFCQRGFESVRAQGKVVIYLFNYDSSKSAFFMLNMLFDVLVLTFVLVFVI